MTRARARARTQQGNVSATPAAAKENVSVRGTDTKKTHTQTGPVAITPKVSVPGTDIPKSHAHFVINSKLAYSRNFWIRNKQACSALHYRTSRQRIHVGTSFRHETSPNILRWAIEVIRAARVI
ncbi:hypothetical protein PHMEG_00034254 [Phytophthora megakarya]|uniref:Uncharacterized protein n=1 Tax=Phytophthora megakarya TaxID=4795 RepID=A0A225USY3_9STRA|nr:hypothetical protein PHMEG_00034254 [Phytophthora megakarya]